LFDPLFVAIRGRQLY